MARSSSLLQRAQSLVEYVLLLLMVFVLVAFFTLTIIGNPYDSILRSLNNITL